MSTINAARRAVVARLAFCALATSIASCGGGGGGGSSTRYSIGGTVSGLSGTLVLQNNGTDDLSITVNGGFTFATLVPSGTSYAVTVKTQPVNQVCSIANGTGAATADVSSVTVTCVSQVTYTIGGTITGLTGAGLKIEAGPTNLVAPVAGDTTFTLPAGVVGTATYDVGISAQPAGQTCVILNAHGVVNSTNVTDVDVRCINNTTSPLEGAYTALYAGPTTQNYYLALFPDGTYLFGSVANEAACGVTLGNGVEYGVYRYNDVTRHFEIRSAVVDTNGSCGLWNGTSQSDGTLLVAGSGSNTLLTLTTGSGVVQYVAASETAGTLVGAWPDAYRRQVGVFRAAAGTDLYTVYLETQRSPAAHDDGYRAGIETSCGAATSFAGGSLVMDPTGPNCSLQVPGIPGAVDTNGTAGYSSYGTSPIPFAMTGDDLDFDGTTYLRLSPP